MSKKRLSVEMQALAWQLQLAPLGLGIRAHHEALIDRLGLNVPGKDGRPMTFNQLRHRAVTAAALQSLRADAMEPAAEFDEGEQPPQDDGRGS